MNRDMFIEKCNNILILIRTEFKYTQEEMANILGYSKKTLIEIEKKRSSLKWSGSVVLCTIFAKSEILASVFGGDPKEIIMALAFESGEPEYPQTLGGKVWWRNIVTNENYKLQKNIVSKHYRLLDTDDQRICSSFDLNKIKKSTFFFEIK